MIVYIVFDRCDCDEPSCWGKQDIAVFTSKQTAEQEADIRSKRWGGFSGRADMHIEKVTVSTKVSKW